MERSSATRESWPRNCSMPEISTARRTARPRSLSGTSTTTTTAGTAAQGAGHQHLDSGRVSLTSSPHTAALTGCSGGNDSPSGEAGGTYRGQLTGAEGTLTIGDVGVTADALTVECSEDGGVSTAALTEPESGTTVTTTQPEGGEGYAAATLTMSGSEIEFVPRDGVTSED